MSGTADHQPTVALPPRCNNLASLGRRLLRGRRGARESRTSCQAAVLRTTRPRVDSELRGAEVRYHSAMSPAEALRRCPSGPSSFGPGTNFTDILSRAVWETIGEIVPAHSSAPGSTRATSTWAPSWLSSTRARAVASAIQTAVRGPHEPDVLARRRHLEGRVQGCVRTPGKPSGITVVPPGAESDLPRSTPGAGCCPARGHAPRRDSRTARVESHRFSGSPRISLSDQRPPRVVRRPHRAQGIDRRDLDLELGPVSVSRRAPSRATSPDRGRLHDEVEDGWPCSCPNAYGTPISRAGR